MDFSEPNVGMFDGFDDMEYLFGGGNASHENVFEFDIKLPSPSYNYIEEIEGDSVNPTSDEAPTVLPNLSEPLANTTISALLPGPVENSQADTTTASVKTRTRRKERPRLHGPNPFGRAGCKRCELCRKHRQKCVYDDPDLPCKRCKERGVSCGAKIWGKKTESGLLDEPASELLSGKSVLFLARPIPKPENEIVTPDDDLYLQYFHLGRIYYGIYQTRSLEGEFVSIYILPSSRMPLLLSSEVVRYAALALASSRMPRNSTPHTFQYLDRCYRCMREALSGPVSIDLAYTSYLLARIDYNTNHLGGFRKIIKHLETEPNGLSTWETRWLLNLYHEVLLHLRRKLSSSVMEIGVFTTQVQTVCNILRGTWYSDAAIYAFNPFDLRKFVETVCFYFSTYILLLLNGLVEAQNIDTSTELSFIISELHQATTYFSECFHTVPVFATKSLLPSFEPREDLRIVVRIRSYLRLKLTSQLLENYDRESPDVQQSARELCNLATQLRMCQTVVARELWEVEDLFLSGMVMTKWQHPEGKFLFAIRVNMSESAYIASRLEVLLSRHRQFTTGMAELLLGFLDQAANCSSFHEILQLKINERSVWQILVHGIYGVPPDWWPLLWTLPDPPPG